MSANPTRYRSSLIFLKADARAIAVPARGRGHRVDREAEQSGDLLQGLLSTSSRITTLRCPVGSFANRDTAVSTASRRISTSTGSGLS